MKNLLFTLLLVPVYFLMTGCTLRVVPQEQAVYRERSVVRHYPLYSYAVKDENHYGNKFLGRDPHEEQRQSLSNAKAKPRHTKIIITKPPVKIEQGNKNRKREDTNSKKWKEKKEALDKHSKKVY
ncbi:hypothetical protein KKE54_06650 [bacterium]|nr:hypothetical protein [bacterium]